LEEYQGLSPLITEAEKGDERREMREKG